jgi:glutaredoxin
MDKYECKDGVCYLRVSTKKTDKKVIPLPNDSDEWTVYGAKWCGYCKKVTELLEKKNLTFVYHDVDDFGSDNIKEQLKDLTNNYKTIPIVFNGNKFIGGYSDLCALEDLYGEKALPFSNDSVEWTVYGANWCPFCKKVTELLEKKNQAFEYYNVDRFGSYNIQKQFKELTNNYETSPIVFNGNKFIGGYSDLCAFDFEEKKENITENTEILTGNKL